MKVRDSSNNCRRLIRPLAPKLHAAVNLKSFIRPDCGLIRNNHETTRRVRWQGGSRMRWSPIPEQICILERLYRGGVRTPSAEQIERITMQLSKYGKIEGKNVFYWFQNHKARERQALKHIHSHSMGTAELTSPPPKRRNFMEEEAITTSSSSTQWRIQDLSKGGSENVYRL